MRIVVTGGSGRLGTEVVRRIRELGHVAVPVSRRWGVDLSTGQGLGHALSGADAVIHCASNPWRPRRTDVEGTSQLLAALSAQDRPMHLVHVSIVGCEENPYPYYRAKAAAEHMVMTSGLPATVVRATQFHTFVAALARRAMIGRTDLGVDAAAQPVDAAWVAEELADHALGAVPEGPVRARDLAGPQLLSVADALSALRSHEGRPASHRVRLPVVGGTMRAFARRTNLPGPHALIGGCSFDAWLARQPVTSAH